MLFGQKHIGVEISPSGIACALVSGSLSAPRLERVSFAALPSGAMRVSLREPNILDQQRFIDTFRSAYNMLLHSAPRISITLPDAVGKVLLLDMEGRFKSREEALDMIRWKLKKNIPFEVNDTHLDYQQITTRDNGDMALMVVLASRAVIAQYEELLAGAGVAPAQIDFNSFNLYRVFDSRLEQHEDMALIAFYDSTLSIMIFSQGIPEFHRVKDLAGSLGVDSRVYMEINSSLMVYRDRFPDRALATVACIAAPDVAQQFCGMVSEAVGFEPLLLEVKSAITPADGAPGDQETLFPFTTAIGAAMRSL